MITFHVVYTPGTVRALLPFAYSLLRAPGVRFTLVDNACLPDESRVLARVAESESRFAYHRLPFSDPARHGIALDHLFARTDEPIFAVLDSDILADGDFVAELGDRPPKCGAICSGWPLWVEDAEAVCSNSQPFLGGPYRTLADGTATGGTACALYDRRALQTALAGTGAGLRNRLSRSLDPGVLRAFRNRGWNFDRFGTARVANLQLAIDGHPIVNRTSERLYHVGGVSHVSDVLPRNPIEGLRRKAHLLMRGNRSPAANAVANLSRRLSAGGRREAKLYMRKKSVVAGASDAMRALRAGDRPASPARTGSAEVDRRVSRFHDALVRDYREFTIRMEEAI